MEKNTEEAFKWIINILMQNNILFQISGGFAAKLYGSERELFDIDIDMKGSDFYRILPFVKDYIVFGPERYRDESFDIKLLTLEYHGQKIDLSSDENAKIYNSITKQWQDCKTNYADCEQYEIFDLVVPVIRRQELIEYKKMIGRLIDMEDIEAIIKKF